MTARINPGDTCLIVGAGPGRECNIGATLRVTDQVPPDFTPRRRVAWQFTEASRPLRIKSPEGFEMLSASADKPGHFVFLLDQHLIPLPKQTTPGADTTGIDLKTHTHSPVLAGCQ